MSSPNVATNPRSAFKDGIKPVVSLICQEIRDLYTADSVPWVIGYSGGKDSTAVLQLVWIALQDLPRDALTKPIHVISTDTLVENPVVATWVAKSLERMAAAAVRSNLPFRQVCSALVG